MKTLKPFVATICLALFVLLVNSQSVLAQETKQPKEVENESPSVQETFNWLKSKLENSQLKFRTTEVTTIDSFVGKGTDTSTMDSNIEILYKNLSLKDCTIQWSVDYVTRISIQGSEDSGSEALKQSVDNKINLSEIDPLGIKVALLEVDTSSVNTSYRNQRVKSTSVSPEIWFVSFDKKYKAGIYGQILFFEDREIAKRVTKAFQNAIKQCGGKVEPF